MPWLLLVTLKKCPWLQALHFVHRSGWGCTLEFSPHWKQYCVDTVPSHLILLRSFHCIQRSLLNWDEYDSSHPAARQDPSLRITWPCPFRCFCLDLELSLLFLKHYLCWRSTYAVSMLHLRKGICERQLQAMRCLVTDQKYGNEAQEKIWFNRKWIQVIISLK